MTILRPPLTQTVVEDIDFYVNPCQLQSEAMRNCSCAGVSLLVASCTHTHKKLPKVKSAPQESYPIVAVLEQSLWYGTAVFQTCLCQTNVQSQDGSSSVVLSVGVLSARNQEKERCWKETIWSYKSLAGCTLPTYSEKLHIYSSTCITWLINYLICMIFV